MLDWVRVLGEEEVGTDPQRLEASTVIRQISSRFHDWLREAAAEPASAEDDQLLAAHLVTAAALLIGASRIQRLDEPDTGFSWDDDFVESLVESGRIVAAALEECLGKSGGGCLPGTQQVHDVVTFHAVRAIDAFNAVTNAPVHEWQEIAVRVEDDILRQLGFRGAGLTSRFDPASLAFSTALLDALDPGSSRTLVDSAADVVAATQGPDGSWPTGRVVPVGGRGMPLVASYEIAYALAVLTRNRQGRNAEIPDSVLDALRRAFDLVTATFKTDGTARGWNSDRVPWSAAPEGWITSLVLGLLVRYRDVLVAISQRDVLAKYSVERPTMTASFRWYDLRRAVGSPRPHLSRSVATLPDPTARGTLAASLEREFLTPVHSTWIERPSRGSLIVTGPAGTGKTSLASALAADLGWPLLTLTPPDFLKRGLEGLEATAAEVFRDLLALRRVVVLFDECEEFFKARPTTASSSFGQRTMGAFITAGMLPRLQQLRRKRWVLFILATNIALTELAPAVVRRGRFDYQLRLDTPHLTAQERYVDASGLSRRVQDRIKTCLRTYDEEYRSAPDGTRAPVSFGTLAHIVERSRHSRNEGTDDLQRELNYMLRNPGPPQLVQ